MNRAPLTPDQVLALAGAGRRGAPPADPQAGDVSDPSELWLALQSCPRPWRAVDVPRRLPGTGQPVGQVAMWPLTQEEQMASNAEADRFTKALLKDPQREGEANLGYAHTYSNEVAVQVLYRACRDINDRKRPAFPSPTLMRAAFSTDEIGVLFNSYCTVQLELGPIIAYMTSEEMEGLIVKLYKGGSNFPFDSLSWEQQKTLLSFLVSQVVNFWTAMFSVGSPPDVGSTTLQSLAELTAEQLASAVGAEMPAVPPDETVTPIPA